MIYPNFTPFPILTTENLVLRKLTLQDCSQVFSLRSDPIVNKFIKREPTLNMQDAENWILKVLDQEDANKSVNWAITLKDDDKLIGQICLWNIENEKDLAEVGYSLLPDFFGKRIMDEALKAVISYGFETLNLMRIDAYTQKDNDRSIKLLRNNHFARNFEFEKIYPDKEELEYNSIYTLIRK